MSELMSLSIAMSRSGKDGDPLDAQFQKLVESLTKDGWKVFMGEPVRYDDILGRSYVGCYMVKDDDKTTRRKSKNSIQELEAKIKKLEKSNRNWRRKCQRMKKKLYEAGDIHE